MITIYDKLGYSYYDLIQDDLEEDIDTFKKLRGGMYQKIWDIM